MGKITASQAAVWGLILATDADLCLTKSVGSFSGASKGKGEVVRGFHAWVK
jgi:hypothetical protein